MRAVLLLVMLSMGCAPGTVAAPEAPRLIASDERAPRLESPLRAVGPFATVDGTELPASTLHAYVRQRVRSNPEWDAATARERELLLRTLVEDHLLDLKADELGVRVQEAELRAARDEELEYVGGQAEYDIFFELLAMTEVGLRELRRTKLRREKTLRRYAGLEVTDAAVDQNLKQRPPQRQPSIAWMRHIMLRIPDGADDAEVERVRVRAAELARRARAPGVAFHKLAMEHSQDPRARYNGGASGPLIAFLQPYQKAAFGEPVGTVTEPHRFEDAWYVTKVVGRREAGMLPPRVERARRLRNLQYLATSRARRQWGRHIQATHTIALHPENLRPPLKDETP